MQQQRQSVSSVPHVLGEADVYAVLCGQMPTTGRTFYACSLLSNGLISRIYDYKRGLTFSLDVLVAFHETQFLDVADAKVLPLLERRTVSPFQRTVKANRKIERLTL